MILNESTREVPADAEVNWDQPDSALVSGPNGHVRRITFRAEDAPLDRYRTIALVVVAHERTPMDPDHAMPRAAESRRAEPLVWMDIAGDLGRGLSPGSIRTGGVFGVGYRVGEPWFASLSAGYAGATSRDGQVEASFAPVTAGFGGALRLGGTDHYLRPMFGLGVERLHAKATDAVTGESASASRWLPSFTVGVDLAVALPGMVHLIFGVSNRFLTGGTAVRVRGERVASFPAEAFDAHLGLEMRFFQGKSERSE